MTFTDLKNKLFQNIELREEYIRLEKEYERIEAELIKELMA